MLKTTITGSLPKPSWLAQPETLWAPWAAEDPAKLEEAKQDAVRLAIRDQEQAGIDIVTDGEQSRQHFVHGILEKIEGIDFEKKTRIGIRDDRYDADCPTVTSALKRMGSIHGDEVTFARAQTDRALKFTMPGPMTIVDTLADEHYGDRPKMAMAFAEILNEEAKELVAAGVDALQFDEPAFNVYLDAVPTWGVEALNRAVEGSTARRPSTSATATGSRRTCSGRRRWATCGSSMRRSCRRWRRATSTRSRSSSRDRGCPWR